MTDTMSITEEFGGKDGAGDHSGSCTDISMDSVYYNSGEFNHPFKFLSLSNRRTPLAYVPDRVIKELAHHLDVASWEHGWEGVATQLHFQTPHILHIKSISSHAPTERLISDCESHSSIFVEDLIKAIYATQNQPALTILCDAYSDVTEAHDQEKERLRKEAREHHASVTSNNQTTPPPQSRPTPSPEPRTGSNRINQLDQPTRTESGDPTSTTAQNQPTPTKSSQNNRPIRAGLLNANTGSIEKPQVEWQSLLRTSPDHRWTGHVGRMAIQPARGSLDSLRSATSAETDDGDDDDPAQGVPSADQIPSKPGDRRPRVLLTYACSNRLRMKQVMTMVDCLVQNKFRVKHEASSQHQMADDKLGWLDTTFRKVDFILVLITPEYVQDVVNMATENLIIDPTDRALNARYIYRLMQSEYVTNRCINKRFIPVLMPAIRALPEARRELVPTWLQNTLVYSWPTHYKNLFFHMIRADRIMHKLLAKREQTQENNNIYVSRS